jgi:hypothetical protein
MKKIKEMYSAYVFYYFRYENVDLPFPDWIFSRCDSKDIGIVDKFWFDYCHYSSMMWNLYPRNANDKKISFL